eukprot:Amastigsp_a676645_163.p3 type:complete len:118 gc:universal Amastigsp_a676645_163:511-158(-)
MHRHKRPVLGKNAAAHNRVDSDLTLLPRCHETVAVHRVQPTEECLILRRDRADRALGHFDRSRQAHAVHHAQMPAPAQLFSESASQQSLRHGNTRVARVCTALLGHGIQKLRLRVIR